MTDSCRLSATLGVKVTGKSLIGRCDSQNFVTLFQMAAETVTPVSMLNV